jgi:hypothetical protein
MSEVEMVGVTENEKKVFGNFPNSLGEVRNGVTRLRPEGQDKMCYQDCDYYLVLGQ